MYDAFGSRLAGSASSATGSDVDHPPHLAVDGSYATFWAGDHDIGLSCECWFDFKQGSQVTATASRTFLSVS